MTLVNVAETVQIDPYKQPNEKWWEFKIRTQPILLIFGFRIGK